MRPATERDARDESMRGEKQQGLDLGLPDSSCQWTGSVTGGGRWPGKGQVRENLGTEESYVLWGIQGKPSAQPSRT